MVKIEHPNTAPLGLYPLKALPRGEYVRRVDVCKPCCGKGQHHDAQCMDCGGKGYIREYPTVWIKGDYNRSFPNTGKYALTKFYDVNTTQYRSGSVLVLAGFTF